MAPFSEKKPRLCQGPVVLVVWDGFGLSAETQANPVFKARMPVWQTLCRQYPHTRLKADGEAVGLPRGRPGNSEAGHATLGAGRPVLTDIVRITRAIENGSFFENPALLQAVDHVRARKSTLHLAGLLTAERSGHASLRHVQALLDFCERQKVPRVALHFFTDGRDTRPFQALPLLQEINKRLAKNMVVASLIGRFYAMDRNRFWERTSLAYHLLAKGEGIVAEDPVSGLMDAYARGESDEFLMPVVFCRDSACVAPVKDHDALVFWNLRSDRARQFLKPFIMHDFETREPGAFLRRVIRRDLHVVTLTEFGTELDHATPAFPHRHTQNTLVEALRYHRQLYAAESEKFSQVTYFFNGGNDRAQFGEERLRVPSLRIARYSDAPDMRANELARRFSHALKEPYDFVLMNFANADMVGHTGNFSASVRACEALDRALGTVWAVVQKKKGVLLLVGDHGNIEQLRTPHGGVDTEHNPHPVPFLIAGALAVGRHVRPGTLADVAPTVLTLLGIPVPSEMTGTSLLVAKWLRHLYRA